MDLLKAFQRHKRQRPDKPARTIAQVGRFTRDGGLSVDILDAVETEQFKAAIEYVRTPSVMPSAKRRLRT